MSKPPKKKQKFQQEEPLKESEDYTDFVAGRVKAQLARDRALANDRLLYAAEDVEDWLLDIGASVDDLDGNQLAAVTREIRRRMA